MLCRTEIAGLDNDGRRLWKLYASTMVVCGTLNVMPQQVKQLPVEVIVPDVF